MQSSEGGGCTRAPYEAYPENSLALLSIWNAYGPKGEVGACLEMRFSANPQETVRFLVAFLPTAWSGETRLPRSAGLMRGGYDAVSRLVDPDFVATQLRGLYGAKLADSGYDCAGGRVARTAGCTAIRAHSSDCSRVQAARQSRRLTGSGSVGRAAGPTGFTAYPAVSSGHGRLSVAAPSAITSGTPSFFKTSTVSRARSAWLVRHSAWRPSDRISPEPS